MTLVFYRTPRHAFFAATAPHVRPAALPQLLCEALHLLLDPLQRLAGSFCPKG